MVRKFDRISIEFSMKFLRKKSIEFLTGISGSNSVMVMPPTHTGGRTQQLRFHACTEPVEEEHNNYVSMPALSQWRTFEYSP